MKSLFTFLLCLFSGITYGQFSNFDFDPDQFTSFDSGEFKFDQIVPDTGYVYWQCISATQKSNRHSKPIVDKHIVAENGDKKYAKLASKPESLNGFMPEGGPVFSYHYIIAVRKNKKVEVINSDLSFLNFIGKIDNIEELKLLACRNRLFVNLKRRDTGSYRKVGDHYLLYLYDHLQSCLGGFDTTEQSVKAVLNANNEVLILSRNYYNK